MMSAIIKVFVDETISSRETNVKKLKDEVKQIARARSITNVFRVPLECTSHCASFSVQYRGTWRNWTEACVLHLGYLFRRFFHYCSARI